jgi:hypothetical protein
MQDNRCCFKLQSEVEPKVFQLHAEIICEPYLNWFDNETSNGMIYETSEGEIYQVKKIE